MIDLSDCIHRGSTTGILVPCSCPSSGMESVHRCRLHGGTCTIHPIINTYLISRGINPASHRSCAQCLAEDDGYTKKASQIDSERL